MAYDHLLDDVTLLINNCLSQPDLFVSIQPKLVQKIQRFIKLLYDNKKFEKSSKALEELYINNCDEEQIWQQLELQNESLLTDVSRIINSSSISKLSSSFTELDKHPVENVGIETDSYKSELSQENTSQKYEQSENESDFEMEMNERNKKYEQSENESDFEIEKNERNKVGKKRKKIASVLDDKFFKLENLNEYLLKEDKKEERNRKTNELDGDQSDSDDSVDLFGYSGNESDDSDGKDIKYADFFDCPDDEENNDNNETFNEISEDENDNKIAGQSMLNPAKKSVTFNLNNDDSEDINSPEEVANSSMEKKTKFEERNERLKKEMEKFEEENLGEKSWKMKGEVKAKDRPEYSLLEEYLEVDITSRPVPVITEETTEMLEDIIKRRIKDKAWDDVEKKFKPVDTPMEYKKKLVLDQEKSKLSLAEIYESDYLRQKKMLNPETNDNEQQEEEPKEHVEIREQITQLFNQLDALSNYHYTPKPAKPEVKIISNVPVINMEEVAPVATSDATLLAPEEIKAKPHGDLIGPSERTKTDMKRARRQKKIRQKNIQKMKLLKDKKIVDKNTYLKTDSYGKKKKNALPKTNITSTAVFNQLQDEVRNTIQKKTKNCKLKEQKNVFSASKLKL